jgi:hypothetical protein
MEEPEDDEDEASDAEKESDEEAEVDQPVPNRGADKTDE